MKHQTHIPTKTRRIMETRTKPKALIVFLFLFLLILNNHTYQVHSRKLASSPSPAPGPAAATTTYKRSSEGRKANNPIPMQGSIPASCHSKCNQCRPCVPVEVSIRTTMAVEQNQYYPIAWRCMCHTNIFSP